MDQTSQKNQITLFLWLWYLKGLENWGLHKHWDHHQFDLTIKQRTDAGAHNGGLASDLSSVNGICSYSELWQFYGDMLQYLSPAIWLWLCLRPQFMALWILKPSYFTGIWVSRLLERQVISGGLLILLLPGDVFFHNTDTEIHKENIIEIWRILRGFSSSTDDIQSGSGWIASLSL